MFFSFFGSTVQHNENQLLKNRKHVEPVEPYPFFVDHKKKVQQVQHFFNA